MSGTQDIRIELSKVELWLATAQEQYSCYKVPADRDKFQYIRYDYYLQEAAREASFALEHLARAVHFFFRKHPEANFQFTETLVANANRYLKKAGQRVIEVQSMQVLRAAVANDEDIKLEIKVDKNEVTEFIQSISQGYERIKAMVQGR